MGYWACRVGVKNALAGAVSQMIPTRLEIETGGEGKDTCRYPMGESKTRGHASHPASVDTVFFKFSVKNFFLIHLILIGVQYLLI